MQALLVVRLIEATTPSYSPNVRPRELLMSAGKSREVKDLADKVQNARAAVKASKASARDKADLKLLEQKAIGAKLRARHRAAPVKPSSEQDSRLDKALKDSFPGSDAVSLVQPAPRKQPGRKRKGR
jgi:hypothetical protein